MHPLSGNYGVMDALIQKPNLKVRQSKITIAINIKETPILKLGLTPILNVTQICTFVNC